MAKHTVKGFISYPFEAEVEIEPEEAAEFAVSDLFRAVDARDGFHFGQLAAQDGHIWLHDSDAEVSIAAVEPGEIEWVDDGHPVVGISDGKGGVLWQEG